VAAVRVVHLLVRLVHLALLLFLVLFLRLAVAVADREVLHLLHLEVLGVVLQVVDTPTYT
jgi:hypothetical protein